MRTMLNMPFGAKPFRGLVAFKEEEGIGAGSGAADAPIVPTDEPLEEEFITPPNEDLTAKFAKELGTGTPAEEKDKPPVAEIKPVVPVVDAPASDIYKPFAYLKGKYEGIELPDEKLVTAENQMDVLVETITKNLDIESYLDPNVAEFQRRIEAGQTFEQILQQLIPQGNNLTDEQKVTMYLQDRYGLKDEEVGDYIPKDPALLKKESLEADLYLRKRNEHNQQLKTRQQQEEFATQERTRVENLERDITASLVNFKNKEEIWGVKLTKEDKTEFEKTYRNWVTPGKDGEPAPIMALLGNDDFLANVVFIASKPNRVKDLIDTKEEKLREFYRTRLALEPDIKHSGKTNITSGELDYEAMKRPAKD